MIPRYHQFFQQIEVSKLATLTNVRTMLHACCVAWTSTEIFLTSKAVVRAPAPSATLLAIPCSGNFVACRKKENSIGCLSYRRNSVQNRPTTTSGVSANTRREVPGPSDQYSISSWTLHVRNHINGDLLCTHMAAVRWNQARECTPAGAADRGPGAPRSPFQGSLAASQALPSGRSDSRG